MPQLVPKRAVNTDAKLIELWCHDKSEETQRYYKKEASQFLEFVGKPITQVTLIDLQEFCKYLRGTGLSLSSQGRAIAAVKALLGFGYRIGVLRVNVGAAIKLPKQKERLAERILPEMTVLAMILNERHPRNQAILMTLYGLGLRVSELCSLCWKDLQPRADGGQLTVYGKGGGTRTLFVSPDLWQVLQMLRGEAKRDEPVFRAEVGNKYSRKGGALSPSHVTRIVRAAALRVGITEVKVSPHWLRHAHATHALDNGCPIHLLSSSLGHQSVATTSRYLHARPGPGSLQYLKLGVLSPMPIKQVQLEGDERDYSISVMGQNPAQLPESSR